MTLENKLEELKQLGHYSIQLWYGEGTGCDDSDVPVEDRHIRVIAEPVGYLGSMRMMWHGSYSDLLEFDFRQKATIISNPPEEREHEDAGYYIWGTERSIELYLERKFEEKEGV